MKKSITNEFMQLHSGGEVIYTIESTFPSDNRNVIDLKSQLHKLDLYLEQ